MTPRTPKLWLLAAEHGVNVLKAEGFGEASAPIGTPIHTVTLASLRPNRPQPRRPSLIGGSA
jgi:hypothetical protein